MSQFKYQYKKQSSTFSWSKKKIFKIWWQNVWIYISEFKFIFQLDFYLNESIIYYFIIYINYFYSFIYIQYLLQYFDNTSCHYQAKISKEKTGVDNNVLHYHQHTSLTL